MSRSKTGTPVIEDHPAHRLKFVDEEIKAQLLKTPTHLVLEQETYQAQLKELRNDWRYAFVIQWLTYFRGAIRMANDPLTVDVSITQCTFPLNRSTTNKRLAHRGRARWFYRGEPLAKDCNEHGCNSARN
jgi:hypothetical protein